MKQLRDKSAIVARWLALALLLPPLVLGTPAAPGAVRQVQPVRAADSLELPRVRSAPPEHPATATWQALPDGGLNGIVYALAAAGNDLYVGGFFTATADGTVKDLNGIALLSGSDGQWHALPNRGLNGGVTALAVIGSDVYAGGVFTATVQDPLSHPLSYIARLTGGASGAWHPLADDGLNWDVRALAAHGSDLYVGGFFDQSASGAVKDLNAVARYGNDGMWHALPNKGLFNFFVLHCCFVDAFAFTGNNLVVGGIFTSTDDFAVQNMGGLAMLSNGSTWSALPNQGLGLDMPFAHYVRSLAYAGSDLYAAGTFTRTTDHTVPNLNGVARLSGSDNMWHALPNNGFLNGNFGAAYALAPRGSDLYVGGSFTQTANGLGPNVNGITALSGGAWQTLPNGGIRSDFGIGVQATAFVSDTLYVAGFFTETAGGAVKNLGNIAALGVPPLVSYPLYLPLVTR